MEILDQILATDSNYILVVLVISFFMMEMFFNQKVRVGSKLNHFFQNILFQLLAIAMGGLLGLMIVSTFNWMDSHQFGLFNWIEVPYWFNIIAGVLLLDLADYWFHRWDHKVPLFWRQHRVHHSDTSMDASTALRGFPTDIIYFTVGELSMALIFGLDIMSFNLFLFLFLPISFIHHANLNYPAWVDPVFGWFFVTPNYHKVHHEQDQFYTDSNYGTLFIIWDKLFGTFKTKPVAEINYGLKEFEGIKKQSFLYQIRSPFMSIKQVLEEE